MGRYHHGDLARALLDASVGILEQEGPHALTLRKAARQAGVSHAAPAHHFGDLRGLLSGVAERGWRGLLDAMQSSDATSALERLRAVGHGYIAFSVAHVGLFRAMFHPELAKEPSPDDPHRVARDATWAYVVSVVEACQDEGTVRDADPRQLARLAWSSVHGAAALLVEGALGTDAAEVAQTLPIDLFLGLRAG